MMTYFAMDGSYGNADSIVVLYTGRFTDEDWDLLENTPDRMRGQIAHAIAEEKRRKAMSPEEDELYAWITEAFGLELESDEQKLKLALTAADTTYQRVRKVIEEEQYFDEANNPVVAVKDILKALDSERG